MSEQTIEKLQELYKSGRYECDVWFYQQLMGLVKSMQMYDFMLSLESNVYHVKKIHKLIEQNSDSLNEDFDEEQAAAKAEEIKKYIHMINTQQVDSVMTHLQRQHYMSYTQHAAKLIQKYNYHPKYQAIVQNILNTVYDPVIRLEHVMVCTLFMLRNAQKIDQILNVYEKCIENALNFMKVFRKNSENVKRVVENVGKSYQTLKDQQELSESDKVNLQTMSTLLLNVQNYCYGIYFIYRTTIKLCDLIKILQGKNNFILKLNSYKPDVQEIVELWDHLPLSDQTSPQPRNKNQLKLIEKQMETFPIRQLQQLFIGEKGGVEKINRTCKICLRYVQKEEGMEGAAGVADYHKVCQAAVKELMKSNTKQLN